MKTGKIRFNVQDRGRQHRGSARRFDTAALAALINSPSVQERVRKRDLLGFFGHWPRATFGMEPREGGIVDGKQITIEPALVTVSLKAEPDGTIEHEAEFLDTAPGRTAMRMWNSKTGGFSSAITARDQDGRDQPIGFFGFDYVMEPNFSTNRGWRLDSVHEAPANALMDSAAEAQLTVRQLDAFCTRLQADFDRQAAALVRAHAENQELLAMLAKRPDAAALRDRLDRAGDADDPAARGRELLTHRRVAIAQSGLGRLAADFTRLDSLAGTEPSDKATQRGPSIVDDVVGAIRRYWG